MARAIADVLGDTGLIMALDSEGPIADYGVEQVLSYAADAEELSGLPFRWPSPGHHSASLA